MEYQKQLVIIAVLFVTCSAKLNSQDIVKYIVKTRKLPNLDVCGITEPTKTRIINGQYAKLGEYPWMARFGRQPQAGEYCTDFCWFCGGSLITDQYIISAAHCFKPNFLREHKHKLIVRLGDLNINPEVDDGAAHIDFKIDEEDIKLHQYDNRTKTNDLALVKLRSKVTFSALIRPICLPPPQIARDMFNGYRTTVAGWGSNKPRYKKQQDHLQKVDIEIQDLESCRRNYTYRFPDITINEKIICASSPGKDACSGDSGGPLMLRSHLDNAPTQLGGNYFLIGVVSYGYGCAIEGFPGLYTRISKHMKWIIDNLEV